MTEDGKTPYLHMAYGWSADGTDRFMTVYPGENLYLNSKAIKDGYSTNDGVKVTVESFDDTTNMWHIVAEQGTGRNSGLYLANYANDKLPDTSDWSYSADVKGTGNIGAFGMAGNHKPTVGTISSEWSRISQTGHFDNAKNKTLIMYFNTTDSPLDVYIKLPKLEIGKMPTPWTPSPLDDPEGAYPKFIGTYTDYTADDSTDPSKYTWAQYVDRSKQKLAIHPKTGADTIGAVGTKLVDLITSGFGNDVSIKLGDYKVYYIDTDGNKSDMVDVPAFTANPSVKPTAVKIGQAAISLTKGGNKVLSATITPDTTTDKSVTYTSSAPEVAKVSATGEVTAVAEGKADITVTSKMVPTITGKCVVTVTPAS